MKDSRVLSADQFCKIYTSFHGEEIDYIRQIAQHGFTGKELLEFCNFVLSKSTTPAYTGAEEIKGTEEYDNAMVEYNKLSDGVKSAVSRIDFFIGFNTALQSYASSAPGDWVRVQDGLPDFKMHSETERVLTYSNAGCVNKGFYYNGKWRQDNGALYNRETITHWRYLPSAPVK